MSKTFNYNGYMGSIDVDTEGMVMHGRILYVNDVVTYEGKDLLELKAAFEEAVDDYLETCKLIGKSPDKPLKGSLNIRIGEALHRDAALASAEDGCSLNDWIKTAVEDKLRTKFELHHHTHYHNESADRPLVTGSFDSSESLWVPAGNVVPLRKEAH